MNPIKLYRESDRAAARLLVSRLDLLHADRLTQEAAGDAPAAVRDARLIQDLVEHATPAQLRAAVVQLTTPELRPAVPVVLGPAAGPSPLEQIERQYRDSPGFRERGL